ncbi:hypothetical protein AW736_01735, partial [Termitidicoccus mucosus]
QFGCARNTVRLWLRRWQDGDDSFQNHSRRPHHQPACTPPKIEQAVVAARKKAPCFGARRLVDMFVLPVGKGAAHRILRDHQLTRRRQRKHKRKADLRKIKAAHAPLTHLQMDTKYLNDIPHYWPQMQAQGLPRFQYTIRDEATGALFVSYSSELSKTCATLALSRLLDHLKAHGLDPSLVEVRTDLGSEFDGDTVHYRPDGFHGSLLASGARHRFNPPARPNANADVESSHATIEAEFFDLETFHGTRHFLASVTTYQHFFNFARKNRSRSDQTPAQLLAHNAPHLDPRILLLPPLLLDPLMGQDLSRPPGKQAGEKARRLKLGIDVHWAQYVVVAQYDDASPRPARRFTPESFVEWVKARLGDAQEVNSCYEAGAFDYVLHRRQEALGVRNMVVRPRNWDQYGKKVKTDQRDALALCGMLDRYLAGNTETLCVIRVPSESEERSRGQTRQRDSLVSDRGRMSNRGLSTARYYGYDLPKDGGGRWRSSVWRRSCPNTFTRPWPAGTRSCWRSTIKSRH